MKVSILDHWVKFMKPIIEIDFCNDQYVSSESDVILTCTEKICTLFHKRKKNSLFSMHSSRNDPLSSLDSNSQRIKIDYQQTLG